MGFFEKLGFKAPVMEAPSADVLAAPLFAKLASDVDSMPVEQLWKEQPHLRTVTEFIARNISSVALHVYRRGDDGGRIRDRDSDAARVLFKANPGQLMQDVLHASLLDLCLFDEFIWFVSVDDDGSPAVYPISPLWVYRKNFSDRWTLRSIVVADDDGNHVELPAANIVYCHGYQPGTYRYGASPVDSLRDVLKEQLEAAAYRGQLWKNGPRLSGVITRPKDAPWTGADRSRFKASWNSQYTGRGSGAGGTPVLEDGMDFKPMHLKAQDEQFVDVAKLALATVASVYHINPTMVGLLDNANYSNVREFRKSLYGDSLGPIIKKLEGVINAFLLPLLSVPDGVYAEFNLDEKLRASFEEKASITTAAVGGPWMTRNEAREQNNLTRLDDGDSLLVPLNTTDADRLGESLDGEGEQ
ncbi:phage portal protein [Corynebacterium argentoratense]|uniref:phage portal protein n=1 Tax=Corynebacterium argentoratense TaxID=42817 RepID=UPI0028D69ADB|nr:phage portal protein [Corynebacterium argentoratense]